MNIEAPLPEGYPAPTPSDCIEIKTYPVERRATVDSTKMWFRGLFGTSRAFFPLFFHIKKREIPMTSPVQMEYSDLNGNEDWKMSFLYRTKDLGPTGEASSTVTVTDGPEVTVISVGIMGEYGTDVVKRGVEQLNKVLGEQDKWVAAGDPRSFNYNGPYVKVKWNEV